MLNTLLQRIQAYDIDIKSVGFTNHLPMVLIALNRLGADDSGLQAYFDFYAKNLKSLHLQPINEDFDWQGCLGENDKFPIYLTFYTSQIDQWGWQSVLCQYIDVLIQGCAASAFHGLIRLSYGVLQQNATEVAFGLAHLSSHYLSVPQPRIAVPEQDLKHIIEHALSVFENQTITGDSISDKMMVVTDNAQFAIINVIPSERRLADFSQLFAELYLRTKDFTVLHAVTSCHDMRLIYPYLNDPDMALKYYWSAALVAILSVEDLKFSEITECEISTLNELDLTDIISSNEDHLIKLVFTAVEQYKHYGDNSYLKIIQSKL
jgi:hypothetical protein